MFSFTAQHILIMRLITQFEISSPKMLHNFIFLASAESFTQYDIGFYDFVRTKNGAFSPTLQSIIEELVIGKLVTIEPMSLTTKGIDTYCALASALRPFENYADNCLTVYLKYKNCLPTVNKAITNHILFRKVKKGKKVF
jgi:hypothetical protein